MNAHRIEWRWLSGSISVPPPELQAFLQNFVIGVIFAHQSGNMAPLEGGRRKENIVQTPFDPFNQAGNEESPEYETVMEWIFARLFEEQMVHVEICHCWETLKVPSEQGMKVEHDLGARYLVIVTEISGIAQSVEPLPETSQE